MKEMIMPEVPGPGHEPGLRALRDLQTRLRRRGIFAGLAVFFSALVFLCLPASVPWVELCRAGGVKLGFVFSVLACALWWRYLAELRSMLPTGLGPTRNKLVVAAWVGGGALLAEGLAWLVAEASGYRFASVLVRPLGGAAVFLAWRWNQLQRPGGGDQLKG